MNCIYHLNIEHIEIEQHHLSFPSMPSQGENGGNYVSA